jgi:hypothetical protein
MNKVHGYRGYLFNIKVELNFKVEKGIEGKSEHMITLNHMGPSNYYQTQLTETSNLEETIELMCKEAEKWIDRQIDGYKSPEQNILESLGFK